MSVGSGLHAGEIDCLVSGLQVRVRWLRDFACDELPDLSREIRLWFFILNTYPKNQPSTHTLALYAPLASGIELFDSFGLSPRIDILDFIDPFTCLFLFSHLDLLYVVTTVLFISIFVLVIIHLVTLFICLLKSQVVTWVKQYIYYLQIRLFILNPCHRAGQRCNLQCQFY